MINTKGSHYPRQNVLRIQGFAGSKTSFSAVWLTINSLGVNLGMPRLGHVAPYGKSFPGSEFPVMTFNFLVITRFFSIVFFIKLASKPRIQCQPIVSSDQLQQVFGCVVAYTLYSFHFLLQFGRRKFTSKPGFRIERTIRHFSCQFDKIWRAV